MGAGVAPPTQADSASVWSAISDRTIAYNTAVSIDLRDLVTGRPTPTIGASGLPSGLILSGGIISGRSTDIGTHTITVTATNSEGSDTETFDITVTGLAPTITAISDVSAAYDTAITSITPVATGDPAPTITVSGLPAGITFSGGVISGKSTEIGTHEITVTATNSQGSDTETFDITVAGVVPVISAIADVSAVYDTAITSITISATGEPTPTITAVGLPVGISLSDGVLSGKSTEIGTHTVTITATNSEGSDTETFDITVTGLAPTITAISDVSAAYDTAITSITPVATGDPAPTITVSGLPAGITFSGGVISGKSTEIGTHEITVTATNSQGSDTETFDITVAGVVPVISAIADVSAAYDTAITSITISATGEPTPTITAVGLPVGISLSDGVLSGKSTEIGTHTVTITATNSEGSDTETFDITVTGLAPTITAISDVSAAYDTAITSITPVATGDPAPTITVSGLPAGITFSGGVISGKSTAVGTHEITVTATNSQGSDTETFDITVAGVVPVISAIADVSAAYDTAITSITPVATGDPAPTITVSGLPAGITFSGGVISGKSTEVGTHEVMVTATNSVGSDTETFGITVAARQYTTSTEITRAVLRSANSSIDPQGITWDGSSVLVLDSTNDAVGGFTDGARDSSKDISSAVLRSATSNILPRGITWDGESVLVLDERNDAVWGFTDGARDSSKDISSTVLRSANSNITPRGITWDGESVLVLDSTNDTVWGFTDGARDSSKDISSTVLRSAASNIFPQGITWDGESVLVLDERNDAVWGFTDGARDSSKDISSTVLRSAASNILPQGITWDGESVLVVDAWNDAVYKISFS